VFPISSGLRSTADPEASIVYRPGLGRQVAYKGHLAVDSYRRIITAADVSPGTADDTTAADALLKGHTLSTGRLPEFAVADSHYGTSEVYNYLDQSGVKAVIKPRRTRNRPGFLTIDPDEIGEYDHERDCYVCPQGETLKLKTYQHTLHRKNYVADKRSCTNCPLRDRCTTSKTEGRLLTRFIDDHFEEADRVINSPLGPDFIGMRRRQSVIEGVFGEAKSFHLLRRALFRGKAKLKISR
jgi:hypothetical protein